MDFETQQHGIIILALQAKLAMTTLVIHEHKSDHPKVPFLTIYPALAEFPLCLSGNQEGLAGRDKVSSRKDKGWASHLGFLHHGLVSGLSLEQNITNRISYAVTECLAHRHCGVVGDANMCKWAQETD